MDSPPQSREDLLQAMRRVSMASIPSIVVEEDQESLLSEQVAERMKHLLTSVRKTTTHRACHLGNDSNAAAVQERPAAFRTLSSVSPFSYLPAPERRKLVLDLELYRYQDGDVIIEQGSNNRDVYILTQGRVMLVVLKNSSSVGGVMQNTVSPSSSFKFLGYLDAPAVVGEYEAIFETRRAAQVVAGDKVTCSRLSGDRFLHLIAHYKPFQLKLALEMRNKGLFKGISSFVSIVRRGALDQKMDMPQILEHYRQMVPAIHAQLHSSSLDIDGWMYAIRRLPDTVTSTYVYLLSNSVPMPFMHDQFDLAEISVPSAARRRLAFALQPGKLLVIMREKFSDVLDFVSLLCAHVHESNKLRLKLNKPASFDVIHGCLWSPERRRAVMNGNDSVPKTSNHFYRQQLYSPASIEEQSEALAKLPLSGQEIEGIKRLWPNDFLYRVWDMIAMHENIQVLVDFSETYVEASDRWAEHIRKAVVEFLQQHNGDADKDTCVSTDLTTHIISSNTTSVRILLSPYIRKHAATIHEWGIEAHPEIESDDALSESDKLCALSTAYLQAHPHARQEQDEFDSCCITTLRHTELTGIQVELIDLDSLCEAYARHNVKADSYLASVVDSDRNLRGADSPKRRRLLVNIDYAFGAQAEQLISALCLLFGESIASVAVMGKAGGLQGKRGDIVVADYLIHQDGDELTLIDNDGVDRDALAQLSNRKVWSGGVLTVLGTLLQDNRLLQYYKKLKGCVSLEMEGSYYAREIMRFKKSGLLSGDLHMRFLYYFSDTPLSTDQTETLSTDLGLSEVIPPQYAVTRELLRLVLAA